MRRFRQHPDVIPGLRRLLRDPELAEARPLVSDMLMYAEIGKDRRRLGPEYVEKVEADARKAVEFAQSWRAAFPSRPST